MSQREIIKYIRSSFRELLRVPGTKIQHKPCCFLSGQRMIWLACACVGQCQLVEGKLIRHVCTYCFRKHAVQAFGPRERGDCLLMVSCFLLDAALQYCTSAGEFF